MSTGNGILDSNITGFYGLVICGGNSTRMGTDKSMLAYQDQPQRYHVYSMLDPFCEKVFISCNALQAASIPPSFFSMTDHPDFHNIGPMAALLTAFHHFPEKDFLVAGCDYPFLKDRDMADLLASVEDKKTTVFYNRNEVLYEPLLGYYSFTDAFRMQGMFERQQFSLQHFLKAIGAGKFYPTNGRSIQSVDNMQDFTESKKAFNPSQ